MLKSLSIKARLILVLSFLSLQLVIGAVIGIGALGFANDAMRSMYDDRLVALGHLDELMGIIDRNESTIAKAVSAPPGETARMMDAVETEIKRASAIWEQYAAKPMAPEERVLAEKFAASRKEYLAEGLLPAVAAVRSGYATSAAEILNGKMATLFADGRSSVSR